MNIYLAAERMLFIYPDILKQDLLISLISSDIYAIYFYVGTVPKRIEFMC